MSRTDLTPKEIKELHRLISDEIQPRVFHLGSARTGVARYDKRENMYGGDGVVYLMQMFEKDELVNNRIGAYMILTTQGDSVGYHTHGTRHEQELYVVLCGVGTYYEKETWEGSPKTYPLQPGNITTIKGDAYHSVINTSDDPLVIFVITTNQPS